MDLLCLCLHMSVVICVYIVVYENGEISELFVRLGRITKVHRFLNELATEPSRRFPYFAATEGKGYFAERGMRKVVCGK